MADQPMLHTTKEKEVEVVTRPRGRSRGCKIAVILFLVLLLLAGIVLLILLLLIVGRQPPRVVTNCGSVEGNFDPVNNVFAFKGIPFAAPPVGSRRWQPPEPLHKGGNTSCWSGRLQAKEYPPACAQVDVVSGHTIGEEDCLYLNVFTPSVNPMAPVPVLVYIHGGYLMWGSGSVPGYTPDEHVTSKLSMVFVSIQYRLGTFGFLTTSALPGRTGNYGFLDQIEALRWVKENIANFGGDPNQVTIFGQSSGGTSVSALMVSPLAKGLFNRAWMSSGSPVFNRTLEQAIEQTDKWLLPKIERHCPNMTEECLAALDVEATTRLVYPQWNSNDWCDLPHYGHVEPGIAVIDGVVVPRSPFQMWEEGDDGYSDVPFMIGMTAQEVDLWPAPGDKLKTWTDKQFHNYVAMRMDPFGQNITNETISLYSSHGDVEYQFSTMATDVRLTCAAQLLFEKALHGLSQGVYLYVVTQPPSAPVSGALGLAYKAKYAFHCWDVYAFFEGLGELSFPNGPSNSDREFARNFQDNLVSFVRTGKPKDAKWAKSGNSTITALISDDVVLTDSYQKEQCNMWMEKGFIDFAWIN